jgi:lysine N6-hydroxylase
VADRVGTVRSGWPVDAVDHDGRSFLIRSGRRVLRARHFVLGTGKKPRVPAFAEPLPGFRVLHAHDLLDVAPSLERQRVVVVGGGQSEAEVILHLLTRVSPPPAALTWVSRRQSFLPLDDSPFTNDWFAPDWIRHFQRLEGRVTAAWAAPV